jgi:hypothetical protein
MAEEILERAKSGELCAIAVAEVLWTDAAPAQTPTAAFLYVPGTSFAIMYARRAAGL